MSDTINLSDDTITKLREGITVPVLQHMSRVEERVERIEMKVGAQKGFWQGAKRFLIRSGQAAAGTAVVLVVAKAFSGGKKTTEALPEGGVEPAQLS
jgi:hypothetical protein